MFTVHAKPDKMAQFEAVAKKITAANRQNKGSDWLALAQEYGPGHTIRIISPRPNFAAIEEASQAFMAAMTKAYGQAATEQIFREVDSCLESSHSEVRRRRWELSSNPPADAAALARMLGEARWVQTTMVRGRPGQGTKVEEQFRAIKAAAEKATVKVTTLVSQAIAGQTGTVYYISTLRKSLARDRRHPAARTTARRRGLRELHEVRLRIRADDRVEHQSYPAGLEQPRGADRRRRAGVLAAEAVGSIRTES